MDFFDRLLVAAPVATDPHLAMLEPGQREAVHAGLDIFRARLAEQQGDQTAARKLLARASQRLAPRDRAGYMKDGQSGDDLAHLRNELEALQSERDAAIGKMKEAIDRLERE